MLIRLPALMVVLFFLVACQASATPGVASSSIGPSASPSSPASGQSNSNPASRSAAPSSTVAPEPTELAPGSEVVVAVDALQLREEPSLAGAVVTTMSRGEVMYLLGPPFRVEGDGYVWRFGVYRSGYDGWPRNPDATTFGGWAAASGGGSTLLEAARIQCPAGPTDLEQLLAMVEWERAVCLGDEDVTIQGAVVTGFGGLAPGIFEPAWLAAPFAFAGAIGTGEGYLMYRQAEAGPSYADGQILRITGHFNDPAAESCRMAPGEPPVPQPDSLAELACRGAFVATLVEPVGS